LAFFKQCLSHPISDEDIALFCKNSKQIEVTRIMPLAQDLQEFKWPEEFTWELHAPENSCHVWYIVCRCLEEFRQEKGRYPGLFDHNNDSLAESRAKGKEEFECIQAKVDAYVSKITPDQKVDEKYVREIMRFSDSKIHTVSAFLGGIASQEIIKILIK
jgi:NEDD8-activating enzyme E1 regulatory subunit